jgi:hypothetical protein
MVVTQRVVVSVDVNRDGPDQGAISSVAKPARLVSLRMHVYHVKKVYIQIRAMYHATQTVYLETILCAGLLMVIVQMDVTKAFGAINVNTAAIIIIALT